MRVDSKVWVVTGGGAGIGREVVLLLLERGARVAAVDLSAERLQETAALPRRRSGCRPTCSTSPTGPGSTRSPQPWSNCTAPLTG